MTRVVDAQFHIFLTSVLHGGVCRVTPRVEMAGGTFWRRERISFPCPESKLDSSVVQTIE
jgi:hypothetical protein